MVFIYGNLHKKGVLLWKQRFFVLKGTSLSYFVKKGDKDPKKVIAITDKCSIARGATRAEGFLLHTPEQELRLRGDNDKEEDEWFSTLQTIIKNEQEKTGKQPQREGTKLWWAETKQGQFCFELDEHYEMRKTIGSGGYGVVISALDRRTQTKTAIKKVVNAFDDLLVAKRMIREIRLLRQFKHENVIRILDMLPPPSVDRFEDVYIVMERMDTDLHHVIYSGQPLKEAHVQFFLYQLLCGLKYIHSSGVIHRDLKPANVLVNTTCELKLCDFGLARSVYNGGAVAAANFGSGNSVGMGGGIGSTSTSSLGSVGGGSAMGEPKLTEYVVTRWWRAPEVFLEADYGAAIDVWSAGCILGEMVQKKPLFMGSNTAQMLRLIMQLTGKPGAADLAFVTNRKARNYVLDMTERPPLELTERFPGLDPQALDLLARMLRFNPAARITVDEALAHPWLSRFHNPELEVVAPRLAELAAVENAPLARATLQRVMFEDVCAFRPECLEEHEQAAAAAAVAAGGADSRKVFGRRSARMPLS